MPFLSANPLLTISQKTIIVDDCVWLISKMAFNDFCLLVSVDLE